MSSSNPTTGVGVAAKIGNVPKTLTLSLSGLSPLTTFYYLDPEVEDVNGTVQTDTNVVLTITSVGASAGSPGHAVYTGTITGGDGSAFAGQVFTVAGFVTNTGNNGTFVCVDSNATTLTLGNPFAIAETHAATATLDEPSSIPFEVISYSPGVVEVHSAGSPLATILEAVAVGAAVIEVSYPTFNNSLGTNPQGTYAEKIYAEINVQVVL